MLQKGLIAALLAGLLSGCAHYMYDGQKFTDRSKAEAAQRAQFDNVRSAAAFKPRAKPVAKNLRFVMPTKTLMLERGILPTGSADGRDYVATTLHADFRFTGELIRQRNIFENMSVEESADAGHVTPKPGESVIYFYMPDSKTGAWYYISQATARTPLNFDRGNPERVGKIKYFIDSVEALAAGEPR